MSTQAASEKVPSCADIGLQAGKKGDFRTARQMLRTALEQLEGKPEHELQTIALTTSIGDTYLNEGVYDSAKIWYVKALDLSENLHGKNSLPVASLIAKLAEVSVLQPDMKEFEKHFENLHHAYLLAKESDTGALLASLIDLSWALCLQGHIKEAQLTNKLITQIKQIAEEARLAA